MSFTNQSHLNRVLLRLFPDHDILQNVRKETQIQNPHSHLYFELDFYIPSLFVGLEFQDLYHFSTSFYSPLSLASVQYRDNLKQELVKKRGIHLIQIPCWWDGSEASLAATIKFARPDLLLSLSLSFSSFISPIHLNPSPKTFHVGYVPDVGELMRPSFPANNGVHQISNQISKINSWWLGEKYDGIRSCWNPLTRCLYSRKGYTFEIATKYKKQMPVLFLDCEVWFGRQSFSDSIPLLYNNTFLFENPFLRLVAFDKPDPETERHYFEKRYKLLLSNIFRSHCFISIAMRVLCKTKLQLLSFLENIIKDGGEGAVMRKPKSPYVRGRSSLLWKFKHVRGDTEALVVQEEVDSSILLQLPSGITFHVPSYNPKPKKGDVVTFAYETFTSEGVPVNGQITRVRLDVDWLDVIREYSSQAKLQPAGNFISTAISNRPFSINVIKKDPITDLRFHNVNSRLSFFVSLARSLNLDPFVPEHWYSVDLHSLMQRKDVREVVSHYNSSFGKALLHLFPNIGLDREKLLQEENPFHVRYQKRMLLNFAIAQGFDPLLAENWHSVSSNTIQNSKDIKFLQRLYNGKLIRAVKVSFPDIGLSNSVQFHLKKQESNIPKNRDFFLQIAKERGFDPKQPENWYSMPTEVMFSNKRASSFLKYVKGGHVTALVQAFPNIGLDTRKLMAN